MGNLTLRLRLLRSTSSIGGNNDRQASTTPTLTHILPKTFTTRACGKKLTKRIGDLYVMLRGHLYANLSPQRLLYYRFCLVCLIRMLKRPFRHLLRPHIFKLDRG